MNGANTPNLRSLVVGTELKVPLRNGTYITAVNFDNAASTPPFVSVMERLNEYAPWYSSVHRGKGFKSNYSTEYYEKARLTAAGFVKADPDQDAVIFTKNTTEGINILAHALAQSGHTRDTVLITRMEHTANDLPWRTRFRVLSADVDAQGRLDLDLMEDLLKREQGRVMLVAVTGTSNLTGYINPVHTIAALAHRYGANIFVDAAQWVPHDTVDMRPYGMPEHIDFIAFSGHKMYAPFGTGVLIGEKRVFEKGVPFLTGGGAVTLITPHAVQWKDAPERNEAGTPCLMGVVALTAAIETLTAIGMDTIGAHEKRLFEYAINGLMRIPGIRIYCDTSADRRIGVFPISLDGVDHALLAGMLSNEAGIAVRDGLFCAHPYCEKLLNLSEGDLDKYFAHPELKKPGLIRISFGLYNETAEIDRLLHALAAISQSRAYYTGLYASLKTSPFCGM